MSLDDRDYMRNENGREHTQRGRCSGLEWEVEEVPGGGQPMTDTLLAGAVGYGVGFLLGFSPFGRILSAAAGAVGSHLASRYHVNLDWDPDRGAPKRDPEPDHRPL